MWHCQVGVSARINGGGASAAEAEAAADAAAADAADVEGWRYERSSAGRPEYVWAPGEATPAAELQE